MNIPKTMQEKYDEIAAIISPYCSEYLSPDYEKLCLHALEKLCRKRPSPLSTGRARTWAAGIIYAIGQNNWIFDKSQKIHMTAEQLVEPLNVSKNTAASKANEIRKMIKIDHYSAEWVLESEIENNSLVWMVTYNGFMVDARHLPLPLQVECAQRGLIPYVPALKDLQEK